jgi:hypothetical protein
MRGGGARARARRGRGRWRGRRRGVSVPPAARAWVLPATAAGGTGRRRAPAGAPRPPAPKPPPPRPRGALTASMRSTVLSSAGLAPAAAVLRVPSPPPPGCCCCSARACTARRRLGAQGGLTDARAPRRAGAGRAASMAELDLVQEVGRAGRGAGARERAEGGRNISPVGFGRAGRAGGGEGARGLGGGRRRRWGVSGRLEWVCWKPGSVMRGRAGRAGSRSTGCRPPNCRVFDTSRGPGAPRQPFKAPRTRPRTHARGRGAPRGPRGTARGQARMLHLLAQRVAQRRRPLELRARDRRPGAQLAPSWHGRYMPAHNARGRGARGARGAAMEQLGATEAGCVWSRGTCMGTGERDDGAGARGGNNGDGRGPATGARLYTPTLRWGSGG